MELINIETLFDVQTGLVAFLAYLWGNGAISRFISRLNQFLLLFSFLVTFFVYVMNNKRRSAKILAVTVLTFLSLYLYSVLFLFEIEVADV